MQGSPDPLDVWQVGRGPAHEGCPPDLLDVWQVGRASIIGQIQAPLTANLSVQVNLGAFAGSPDLLDVWQVRRGLTRWEGRERVKKSRKMKVLRMRSSIVENVPTPRETIFKLSPASQLPYRAKIQNLLEILKLRIFPYFLYQPTLELFSISET